MHHHQDKTEEEPTEDARDRRSRRKAEKIERKRKEDKRYMRVNYSGRTKPKRATKLYYEGKQSCYLKVPKFRLL